MHIQILGNTVNITKLLFKIVFHFAEIWGKLGEGEQFVIIFKL